MIAKMKKVTLVTTRASETESLERLRDLGLVHVNARSVTADSVERLREQRSRIERAVQTIEAGDETAASGDAEAAVDRALSTADAVIDLSERRAQLHDELDRTEGDIERYAPWGEIDPAKVAALQEVGVSLYLAKLTSKQLKAIDRSAAFVVGKAEGANLVAFVTVGEEHEPVGTAVPLPTVALSGLEQEADRLRAAIGQLDKQIEDERPALPTMLLALKALEVDLEFAATHAVMDGDKHLSWITGFVPTDALDAVTAFGREKGIGVVTQDPDETDEVPTKLRNPAPVRIIRPVFDLLGTVPGYRELDISFFFLLFFMLFFAMIIGDGAYGAIILLGSGFAAFKSLVRGKAPALGTVLLMILSVFTIGWGAITGNWFGYSPFNDLPFLRDLVVPALSIDNPSSQETIQYYGFVIGIVHLGVAHIWNIIRELRGERPIRALVEIGWMAFTAGAFFLVLYLVLDPAVYPIPQFVLPLVLSGLGLVFVFQTQQPGRSFGRGLLASLSIENIIGTPLSGVGYFGDIISYIRLYAVGLASFQIATAFNSMALGIRASTEGIVGVVASILVLAFGHSLNLIMGALSVIVHGVRLNMLEFSGRLGMEWTGVNYTPFKTHSIQGE